MIALVVTMTVAPENQPAFEAAMGEMARASLENEPGVKLYQLCKSREDPSLYRLFENYADQAALDSHLQTPWYKAAGPIVGPLLSGPVTMEFLDTVA
jgi:quinol monooxygenase YgiN